MIILSFNKTTKTYEKEQITEIVAGSKQTIQLKVRFGSYEEGQFVHDLNYARDPQQQVGVIFVRPDGEETWFIPLSLQSDGYFLGVLEGWVLRKSGELKVRVQNRNIDDNTTVTFAQVLLPVLEGTSLDDADFSFSEAEYDAILSSISNINYNLTRKADLDENNKVPIEQLTEGVMSSISDINDNLTRKADLDENNKVPPEQLYETYIPEDVVVYKGKIGADEIPKKSEEHFLSFTVIDKRTGVTEYLAPYGIYSFLFDIYSENIEVLELREDGIPIQEGAVTWAFDGTNYIFSAGVDWIFQVSGYGISFNIDIIKDNSTYEIDFKSFNNIKKGDLYTVIDPFTLNDTNYEAGTNIFWDGTEW